MRIGSKSRSTSRSLSPLSWFVAPIAICIFGVIGAAAHQGATGIVKERMDMMDEIGKSFATIGNMVRGKTKFDANIVNAAAQEIKSHAIEVRGKFPDTKDSRFGKHTQALESVWLDRPGFNYSLSILEHEAEKLAKVTDIGSLKTQFLITAKSCTSCHEKYRKPQ